MATINAINTTTIKPCFAAYLSAQASSVTGDGTDYTILSDTIIVDNYSAYSAGTGIYTIPYTGFWSLNYSVSYAPYASNTGGTQCTGKLIIDSNAYAVSTSVSKKRITTYFSINAYIYVSSNILMFLSKGSTVKLNILGEGGSKLDSIAPRTAFSCNLLY